MNWHLAQKYIKEPISTGKIVQIKAMQIKTTRYHFIPTRMSKIKKNGHIKHWWRYRIIGSLIHCWWEYNNTTTLENHWEFLMKLNIYLLNYPARPQLSIHPREMKEYVHKSLCTRMFIEALLIITKQGNLQMSIKRRMGKLIVVHL